jgi:hypothetical protein
MAAVAPCAKVVEIEPQIRPLRDGDLMISVQVAGATIMAVAKLGEHPVRRKIVQTQETTVGDDTWFPTAVHTTPAIPLKAENSQPAVIRIVSALGCRTAPLVMTSLSTSTVQLARTARSEFRTARRRARS